MTEKDQADWRPPWIPALWTRTFPRDREGRAMPDVPRPRDPSCCRQVEAWVV